MTPHLPHGGGTPSATDYTGQSTNPFNPIDVINPRDAADTGPFAGTGTGNAVSAAWVHIVDDDDGVRGSLAALLQARGHQVQTYASGADFLACDPVHELGCVLLDLRMDGMSGLQVFSALRARNTFLKTVFLSAHGELASAVAAVAAVQTALAFSGAVIGPPLFGLIAAVADYRSAFLLVAACVLAAAVWQIATSARLRRAPSP